MPSSRISTVPDILLDQPSLLREAGEHPPLGKQFPEEVLPAILARSHGHHGEWDRDRQDGAINAEPGNRLRDRQEIKGPPRAREHPGPCPV